MKPFLIYCVGLLLVAPIGAATQEEDVAALEGVVERNGLDGLLVEIRANRRKVPFIPSPWHTEHVATPHEKPSILAARDFGKTLAHALSSQSAVMQAHRDEALHRQTLALLDLAEWCGSVEGVGNVLLAQRCLDLAAVGVARLTVDLTFPMEAIDALVERLSPPWLRPEIQVRILNKDAGEEIFTRGERDDMARVWGVGQIAVRVHDRPELLKEIEASGGDVDWLRRNGILRNIEFFRAVGRGSAGTDTLISTWDENQHGLLVGGLGLSTVSKAKALAEFRRAIGAFPEKPSFTEEELKDRSRVIEENAKKGLTVVPFEDAYESPTAAAFSQVWMEYITKKGGISQMPTSVKNLNATAYRAYVEVTAGTFRDQDGGL